MGLPKRRQQPTSFTAGRKITLGGVTYAKGAVIPNSAVKGLRRLSSLLSRRWIIPNRDPHFRQTKPHVPTPTALGVRERRGL